MAYKDTWLDKRTSLEWITECLPYVAGLEDTIIKLNTGLPKSQQWRVPTRREALSLIDNNKQGSAFLLDAAEKAFKDEYANMMVKVGEREYEKVFCPFHASVSRFYPGCNPKVRLVRGKILKVAA